MDPVQSNIYTEVLFANLHQILGSISGIKKTALLWRPWRDTPQDVSTQLLGTPCGLACSRLLVMTRKYECMYPAASFQAVAVYGCLT